MIHQEDLSLYRGDDTIIKVTFTTQAGEFPIGDSLIEMEISPNQGQSIRLSSDNGLITKLDTNSILLHFDHALTQNLTWKKADYDLQITQKGKVKTLMRGKVFLTHDITR